MGEGLDNRILSLYSKGMSYADIQQHLEELYGLEMSTGQLSAITDQVLPVVEQWCSRPLEAVYAFVWLDAVHFKVRQDGKVVSKAAYKVLGVDLQGKKDLLGIYIGDAESARFWLSVLTDLQNRGIKGLLICSIDNLSGFGDAIEAVFPQADRGRPCGPTVSGPPSAQLVALRSLVGLPVRDGGVAVDLPGPEPGGSRTKTGRVFGQMGEKVPPGGRKLATQLAAPDRTGGPGAFLTTRPPSARSSIPPTRWKVFTGRFAV